MALIVIDVDRGYLPAHTEEEFVEWVKYSVGDTGTIPITNPLSEVEMYSEVKEIGL